jgi:eukaryotic-like serine/threonine-protein kinase
MEVSHAVMLIGSPVEMEGRIYFGSTNGNLYSADAETGALRWKFDAKSRIPSNPTVAEGTV